jgi:glycosyltransferase involved in cell wall biosynthesis
LTVTALISVVIPTHNRSSLLAQTLRTALWQRDVHLEVIVVDDGSTDDTAERVRAIGDPRVRLLRHDVPLGVSIARNHGIKQGRGAWIAFLDDDDLWAPSKLSFQMRAARETGRPWVYVGSIGINDRDEIIGGKPPPRPEQLVERLPRWNIMPGGCSGVVVSRTALDSAGQFLATLTNLADWDLWLRLARTAPPACVSEPLVGYRFHHAQSSLDVDLIMREAHQLARVRGIRVDRGALHHYLAHRSLLGGARGQAIKHLALAVAGGELGPVTGTVRDKLQSRFPSMARFRRASPDPYLGWRAKAETWLAQARGVDSETVRPFDLRGW